MFPVIPGDNQVSPLFFPPCRKDRIEIMNEIYIFQNQIFSVFLTVPHVSFFYLLAHPKLVRGGDVVRVVQPALLLSTGTPDHCCTTGNVSEAAHYSLEASILI